ncbi:MAG: PadR family transcriptional regulator [Promethearchaeota archaeon]
MRLSEVSTQNEPEEHLMPSYLTVLHFIANGPKYGYQIIQLLKKRNYREWLDIKDSAIYRSLHQLEKRGLITGKLQKRPSQTAQRVYTITKWGQKVYSTHIFKILSQPPPSRSLFGLGISALTVLERDQLLHALSTYRDQLYQRCKYLRNIVETLEKITTIRESEPNRLIGKTPVSQIPIKNLGVIHALFERPYSLLQAEIQWLDKFIQRIKVNPDFPELKLA